MRTVLEFVVRSLVDTPDEVSIAESSTDTETRFRITVAKSDLGQVIGKQGRIANAIRTLSVAIARKYGNQTLVKIDIDGDHHEHAIELDHDHEQEGVLEEVA
jgi:uncharacterized protein